MIVVLDRDPDMDGQSQVLTMLLSRHYLKYFVVGLSQPSVVVQSDKLNSLFNAHITHNKYQAMSEISGKTNKQKTKLVQCCYNQRVSQPYVGPHSFFILMLF